MSATAPSAKGNVLTAVRDEVLRWGDDSLALVKAPASWGGRDWSVFAGVGLVAGGVMAGDREGYRLVLRNQTASRDDAARFVSRFGAEYSIALSAGLLAGGLGFGNEKIRDMGRDAIEASILSSLLTNVVIKPVVGRERPSQSGGSTVLHPFSSYASFPSGHTTQAFTVASVIAMRSEGWVVPTVSYTVASLVAVARVYQLAHFPSDVVAGAVVGTVVGRFVVSRHRATSSPVRRAELTVVPYPGGLGLQITY